MDSTGLGNRIWIQQRNLDWYMTKPLVDITEDPTGICACIGWIQLDKVMHLDLTTGFGLVYDHNMG
jgi:hypothetical protein